MVMEAKLLYLDNKVKRSADALVYFYNAIIAFKCPIQPKANYLQCRFS